LRYVESGSTEGGSPSAKLVYGHLMSCAAPRSLPAFSPYDRRSRARLSRRRRALAVLKGKGSWSCGRSLALSALRLPAHCLRGRNELGPSPGIPFLGRSMPSKLSLPRLYLGATVLLRGQTAPRVSLTAGGSSCRGFLGRDPRSTRERQRLLPSPPERKNSERQRLPRA
jgi:hypothetical protein